MDEVFGVNNFIIIIVLRKSGSQTTGLMASVCDYIVWYCKNKDQVKYNPLYIPKVIGLDETEFNQVINKKGEIRTINNEEKTSGKIENGWVIFKSTDLNSRSGSATTTIPYTFQLKTFHPRAGAGWRTNLEGLTNLEKANRLLSTKNTLRYLHYFEDFPYSHLSNIWDDLMGASNLIYVVQTNEIAIQRCLLMSTEPGDLILDPTCGSGTSAYVAEQWGRRWITCDTSRIALSLAKQRLMTAKFDYYQLARTDEGVGSGFVYKTVPHITLKSIANNEPPSNETLYDQPLIDNNRIRITGPFTVESIPAPVVKDLEGILETEMEADNSVSRTGETHRQGQWRDELLKTGVRAKGGSILKFTRVEALAGTKYIQAQAETKSENPEQVLIVFGPEHAPLEQRTVELAINEARYLKPNILLFCAFQFDDEAAKDIDETPERLIGFKLLKAHMNMDLQTDDLKKSRNTNQSFWLIGQPDVHIHEIKDGSDKGKVTVEVSGFDYYNPRSGTIESGGKKNIAMWLLDTDYDGRSVFPKQVFFPISGSGEGWDKLAKNLKSEIDEEKMDAYNGTISLPFNPGKIIAVKIIDDRGIESLKIIKR